MSENDDAITLHTPLVDLRRCTFRTATFGAAGSHRSLTAHGVSASFIPSGHAQDAVENGSKCSEGDITNRSEHEHDGEPVNESKFVFIEILNRLNLTLADDDGPASEMPEGVAHYIPLPEDIKLGERETQLRLMFGSMLSDLLLTAYSDMGLDPSHSSIHMISSDHIPEHVSSSLLLDAPYTIRLSDFEIDQIWQMRRFLKTRNVRLFGTVFEDGRYMLRFLQGNKWCPERTLEDMYRHMEWRAAHLPIRFATVAATMPKGLAYIHGRDKAYRPILVLRGKAIHGVDHDDILQLIFYWLEYIVWHLLYPTRVEQWNVILDLAQCPFYSVPVMMLKDIAQGLQRNYMCRLSRLFVVNSPTLVYGIWSAVCLVLRETTTQKIKFLGSNFKELLLERIHPDQLEVQYGGNCEELTDYHLPMMPAGRVR